MTTTSVIFESPWLTLVAKPLDDGQPYYMLELSDYVSIVALTPQRRLLLVRQYRPVVDRFTTELPSGHVDAGETPEDSARRELLEETGYVAGRLELMGTLVPDVGRLTNRMWCYFAPHAVPGDGSTPREAGIEVIELPPDEALSAATNGTVDHALNLSALFLALATRRLALPEPGTQGDRT